MQLFWKNAFLEQFPRFSLPNARLPLPVFGVVGSVKENNKIKRQSKGSENFRIYLFLIIFWNSFLVIVLFHLKMVFFIHCLCYENGLLYSFLVIILVCLFSSLFVLGSFLVCYFCSENGLLYSFLVIILVYLFSSLFVLGSFLVCCWFFFLVLFVCFNLFFKSFYLLKVFFIFFLLLPIGFWHNLNS